MRDKTTFTEEITSDETSYDLVTIADGKSIVIESIHLSVAGDTGEVDLEIDGTKLIPLYSSQRTELTLEGLSIYGGNGNNLQLTGDGNTAAIFVCITYSIEEV